MSFKIKHMIKFISIVTLSIFTLTASGQNRGTLAQLPNRGDTIIIGIKNKIELEQKAEIPVAVESSDARVSIEGSLLTIMPPNKPGEVNVKLIYKDSLVIRRFYSIYLPRPSLKN